MPIWKTGCYWFGTHTCVHFLFWKAPSQKHVHMMTAFTPELCTYAVLKMRIVWTVGVRCEYCHHYQDNPKLQLTFCNLNSQHFSLLLHVWNLEIYNFFSFDDLRVWFFAGTFFEMFDINYNCLPFHLDIAIQNKIHRVASAYYMCS